MQCDDAQNLLLDSDDPTPDALPPGPLAEHVAACAGCRQLGEELGRLESAWRALPVPPEAERAKAAFLERLPVLTAPRRRVAGPRQAVAAMLALAAAVLVVAVVVVPRSRASADVVERLVDLNLVLARTPSATDRDRLLAERSSALRGEVVRARLSDDERQLAESLLDAAPQLAGDSDPLDQVDRLNDVADSLLRRATTATGRGDNLRAERYSRLYRRVEELGIASRLDRIEASGALDFLNRRKFERLIVRDLDRLDTLEELLERAPDASRKEIKRALKIVRTRARKKRSG